MLQLYIGDDNKEAGPFDFKKALDLLEYVNDQEEKEELRRRIWCQAVLRDDWEDLNLDYPMETCKNMIFCQLFELLGLDGTFIRLIIATTLIKIKLSFRRIGQSSA